MYCVKEMNIFGEEKEKKEERFGRCSVTSEQLRSKLFFLNLHFVYHKYIYIFIIILR